MNLRYMCDPVEMCVYEYLVVNSQGDLFKKEHDEEDLYCLSRIYASDQGMHPKMPSEEAWKKYGGPIIMDPQDLSDTDKIPMEELKKAMHMQSLKLRAEAERLDEVKRKLFSM